MSALASTATSPAPSKSGEIPGVGPRPGELTGAPSVRRGGYVASASWVLNMKSTERTESVTLSCYGRESSSPSPVAAMAAAFAEDFRDGMDINLGVGYVNERTIPVAEIVEGVRFVLAHPAMHRQALNYGGGSGSPNLIRSLRKVLPTLPHGAVTPEVLSRKRIIIGPSGATSLLDGIAWVLERGIVLTTDPMYYVFCNTLERRGFEVVTVPEDAEGMDPEALAKAIDALGERREAIRFIYIVTVNNPSGTILSNGRRRALVGMTARLSQELGREVPLVLDKAYEFLVHDPDVSPLESMLPHDEMGIVYELSTLSKIFAPALRVGYLIGPDGPFLRALVQYTADVGFSAPVLTQEVASYLLDRALSKQMQQVNAGYRTKARQIRAAIHDSLSDSIEGCSGGSAGFYFYLTLREVETNPGSPFFNFLTRTTGEPDVDGPEDARRARVAYIPGAFCVNPMGRSVQLGNRQLRISYGFEEVDRIEVAVEHMGEAVAYARGMGKNGTEDET